MALLLKMMPLLVVVVVAAAVIAAPIAIAIAIVKTMKLETSLFLLVALKRRTQLA